MVIVGKETKEHLVEVLNMLKNAVVNNPQVNFFRILEIKNLLLYTFFDIF